MWLFHSKLRAWARQAGLASGLSTAALLWTRAGGRHILGRLVLLAAGSIGITTWVLLLLFVWPRSLPLSFADATCFSNPTFLPGLMRQSPSPSYTAAAGGAIRIAGRTVYARSTCITPIAAPRPGTSERVSLHLFGISLIHKNVQIVAGPLPSVKAGASLTAPIATDKPVGFRLSTADRVFAYRLNANGHTTPCTAKAKQLLCNPAALQLAQSSTYTLSLERLFDGRRNATILTKSVTTVGAVQLTGSSIANGATVYDAPSHLMLTFNKPVKSFSGAQLTSDDSKEHIAITTTSSGNTLDLVFKTPLARQTKFQAHIATVTAPDGGHLPQPLVVSFTTSGGPKVQSVSIGSYKVGTGDNINLNFDTAVSADQNLAGYIRLEIGGSPVAATLSRSGSRVTINPGTDLPRCARFTLKVLDGLQNEAGIAGGSTWSYSSRVICQSSFSIGKSVQGRTITAYRFGTGNSLIVYAGTIHGNEKSADYTLTSWMDYLERNYDQIPGGRTIVVIPRLNPDGFNINNRTNAHNVDLNRNFQSANWKQAVTMPGGALNPNGGGSSPLSEPESSALADYIASSHPRLVLAYHAAAGIVNPNESGDSVSLAHTYDQKSNVNFLANSQSAEVFQYDTTGSFEDWAAEKHNTPVLLVELWTKTNNEFGKHQSAMWYMATL